VVTTRLPFKAVLIRGYLRLIERRRSGLEDAYLRWLHPANFDAAGNQLVRLSALTAPFVYRDSRDASPPLQES